MSTSASTPTRTLITTGVAVLALIVLCCCGGVFVLAEAGTRAATAQQSAGGSTLRPDAPVPPAYLNTVLAAGSLCPQIGPAEVAAQIDLESSWNPTAYTDTGQEPARGIAQFTDATWKTWGHDYNGNGTSSPTDPGDAIIAQGHLMCDLVAWATQHIAAGRLRGDPLDVAWAAYFDGRGGVLAAGGVPAGGLAHDYPQQIRARLAKYSATDTGAAIINRGGWTLPLTAGAYHIGDGFGPRWGRLHAGVDLIAPTGTPIYAAAAGVVLDASCTSASCDRPGNIGLGGCGWTITINHGGGIVTRYCHAVRLNVATATQVSAGQLIAWVGSTGNADGAHLHFEVHHNAPPAISDNAIEPIGFLRSVGLNP